VSVVSAKVDHFCDWTPQAAFVQLILQSVGGHETKVIQGQVMCNFREKFSWENIKIEKKKLFVEFKDKATQKSYGKKKIELDKLFSSNPIEGEYLLDDCPPAHENFVSLKLVWYPNP